VAVLAPNSGPIRVSITRSLDFSAAELRIPVPRASASRPPGGSSPCAPIPGRWKVLSWLGGCQRASRLRYGLGQRRSWWLDFLMTFGFCSIIWHKNAGVEKRVLGRACWVLANALPSVESGSSNGGLASRRRAHHNLPLRCADALRRVSAMSGATWRTTTEDLCTDNRAHPCRVVRRGRCGFSAIWSSALG
jgi:hypothetical protein